MRYLIKYRAVMILLSLLATLVTILPVAADDSQLRQVISGYDCEHSTFETAEGQANNVNCAVFSPSIDEFITNGGQPIIRGVYDSVHSNSLSVTFNSKVYLLGGDVELVQNGNLWVLDLSAISPVIGMGSYTVLVEMTNQLGQNLSASRTFDIYSVRPDPVPTSPGPLSPTGQDNLTAIVIGISTVMLSIGIILLHNHIRKK